MRSFQIPKKLELANFNSYENSQDFPFLNGAIGHVIVDGAVSSNPLIVWNNPFGVKWCIYGETCLEDMSWRRIGSKMFPEDICI